MGSVAFPGEDESHPVTCNGNKHKLPKMILEGDGEVNHSSVPKKLRSAIKKRGRESITLPLLIQKKKHHVSNGVVTLRKDGTKKSKMITKKGRITKDEVEVAETLYALAGMFSDAKMGDHPGLDHEQTETKSSAMLKEGGLINAAEEEDSGKISLKVIIEGAARSSNMVDSTAEVKSQSLGAQQPECFSSREPATHSASMFQSKLCLGSRPSLSILGMAPRSEWGIDLEQEGVSVVQNGKNYYHMDDKCKDMFASANLSATRALRSETPKSCSRFSAGFELMNFSSQIRTENSATTAKYAQVSVESKNSWRRCTAHVYISRLIKVLQISERKEALPENPTQLTACGVAELQPRVSTDDQITLINGRNSGASSSGINGYLTGKDSSEIQNDILLHKRPAQDQQMASETSALCSTNQGYDFLSLGTGLCGLDASESVNKARHSHEPLKQYHASYMQSQDHSAMLFPLPQNGHSSNFQSHNSALPIQQVQLPQYHITAVKSSLTGQQLEPHQQKWAAQLQTHYNTSGGGAPSFAEWENRERDSASVLNYAHALFPHLNAALCAKYQQFPPSQQQHLLTLNNNTLLPPSNMNMKTHHHHLPLGYERNGVAFCPENIPQLQLPCNEHRRNR